MDIALSKEEEQRYTELLQMALDFARANEKDTLQSMIEHGINVNLEDHKGNTLLMLASYNNNYETTKMLIGLGADVNKANFHDHTPLAGAAFKGYLDICKLLVENGAAIKPDNKSSAITFAAIFGRNEVVKYLLDVQNKKSSFLDRVYLNLSSFIFKIKKLFKR